MTDTDSKPEPIPESAADPAESAPEPVESAIRAKRPHPVYANRWSDGTQRKDAEGIALKKGLYVQDRSKLPESYRKALANLEGFNGALVQHQGGAEALTGEPIRSGYIERLTEAEAIVRLAVRDLIVNGIYTPRGRVRTAPLAAYFQAVSAWDKLAQRLGIGRRQRDISTMSAAEYHQHFAEQEEGIDDDSLSDSEPRRDQQGPADTTETDH
jgi:hypothetical protein